MAKKPKNKKTKQQIPFTDWFDSLPPDVKEERKKRIEDKRAHVGTGCLTYRKAKNSWIASTDFAAPYVTQIQKEYQYTLLDALNEYLTLEEQDTTPLHELDNKLLQFVNDVLYRQNEHEKYLLSVSFFAFLLHVELLQLKQDNQRILTLTTDIVRKYIQSKG
jgi:uncharacterized membrane protein YgaE (UPF0421/DUF939 family)